MDVNETKKYILTDKECVTAIANWLAYCGSDEMGRIIGEVFGGECTSIGENNNNELEYEFEPNQNYYGEWDK